MRVTSRLKAAVYSNNSRLRPAPGSENLYGIAFALRAATDLDREFGTGRSARALGCGR
jgi:hypothetical protein